MALLPPELCAALLFPGQFVPYSWLVTLAAGVWAVIRVIAVLLPLEASLAPVIGALITGFEIGQHKILATLILYVAVSGAIVAGKLPICTAYLPAP